MRVTATETYNAGSEGEDGSQGVRAGDDDGGYGFYEYGSIANETDEERKSAGDSTVDGGCWCVTDGLPLCHGNGETEDNDGEEDLEEASDETRNERDARHCV